MDLRRKASLVVLLLTLSLMLALMGLSDRALLRGFLDVEAGNVRDRMVSLSTVLHRETAMLGASVRDYAIWDETSGYLEGTNSAYPKVHISDSTFDQTDGFFLFDTNAAPRITLARSAQGAPAEAAPEEVAAAALLAGEALESSHGVATRRSVRNDRLVLSAACAVRPTDGEGPPRGVLVQTRSFGVADLDSLLLSVDLQISMHPPDGRGSADLAEAAARLSNRTPTLSMPRDDNTIAGYLLLTGETGEAEGILRVKATRALVSHGRRSLQVFLVTLVATCAIFGIPAAWLVDRLVRTGLAQREGEERFRAVTESARDAIFAVREDRIVSWNRGARRMFGHEGGEILGRSPALLFPPEPGGAVPEGLNAVRAPATDPMLGVPREVRAVRKNGQEFPAEVSVGTWNSAEGEFRSVILRDITDRRNDEAALRASETKYRIISEHTSDWELWTAPDGRLLYSSPSCEQITGRPARAFLDDPDLLRRIVHPEDLAVYDGHCGRADTGDRGGEIEFRIVHRDGNIRWLAHTCLRVYDDEGANLGIRASNRDVSARRKAEEERTRLEEQVRNTQKLESLGVLTGGIAHDFNNLLVGILGNVEMALDADLPPEVRESLAGVRSAGTRAADLVRQMLAYSGRTTVALRPIDAAETLRASAPLMRAAISHRIVLDLDLPRGLPPVQADPAQLRQIAMNLIVNAAEAIGEKTGTVRVGMEAVDAGPGFFAGACPSGDLDPGPYVALQVSDDGPGIPDDVVPKIFDPFFTTKFTGRGLGLPVVQGIVRAHRGAIRIRTASGHGTTVIVYLPVCAVAAPPRQDTAAPAEAAAWKGSGLALVIDDEPLVRDVATRMISRLGFDVITASDGVEGLRAFRERADAIRVVVLDLTMPRMDGEATLKEIRALRTDVPVILASGFSELDVAQVGQNDPRVFFLQKPFRLPLLTERLRRALDAAPAA
ncbi:MAG: PAS domain S-box protein [Lentisphaerae bacterium]|nr:PAS domain S-box protein [Lentisphaerota bacterium]